MSATTIIWFLGSLSSPNAEVLRGPFLVPGCGVIDFMLQQECIHLHVCSKPKQLSQLFHCHPARTIRLSSKFSSGARAGSQPTAAICWAGSSGISTVMRMGNLYHFRASVIVLCLIGEFHGRTPDCGSPTPTTHPIFHDQEITKSKRREMRISARRVTQA